MQSVNIQHIDNPDLFHLWYNNQDGSWSFILLTAETNYTNAKRCAYRIVQNEIVAAKQIWDCSVVKNKFSYTIFCDDGDSKSLLTSRALTRV